MHERLIIDGNSVYEVDEECLKRRNVPTECRVKEAVERQIQKEKATKEGEHFICKKGCRYCIPFWLCTLLRTFLTQILEDSAASVSAAIASATE